MPIPKFATSNVKINGEATFDKGFESGLRPPSGCSIPVSFIPICSPGLARRALFAGPCSPGRARSTCQPGITSANVSSATALCDTTRERLTLDTGEQCPMSHNMHQLEIILSELPSHLAERFWLAANGAKSKAPRANNQVESRDVSDRVDDDRSESESNLAADDLGPNKKRVLYWTHHALRTDENPALDVAIHLANRLKLPLVVYQGLSEKYRFASDRHHTFILEAARDLQAEYEKLGITYTFHLDRKGVRSPALARLALSSAVVVTEDFPLEATKQWTDQLIASGSTAVVLVDTACVVPTRMVGKAYDRAFAFRDATSELYRTRIDRTWPKVQLESETRNDQSMSSLILADCSLAELVAQCDIDHSIGPVSDTRGGMIAGYARWNAFRQRGLRSYAKKRNQIELDGVSRMSAYLHYGMVSPFRLAREASEDKAEKFLDELLIWRELAYAFCYYRADLESSASLPAWAIATMNQHASDPRTVLSWETLARASTGSRLWDAAQRSLIKHGELHNNVRMTWGKAILEWSSDILQSLERLVDLNHRYALDGRDPASYGGILWCLGQFDRPFYPEQPVLGSVRSRPVHVHEQRTDLAAYEKRVDRPIAEPLPRIAMIGAGLGGLMCSRILRDHGLPVVSFEKSHRPGGRSCTRKLDSLLQFDHGAQYFTVRDPDLKRFVDSWIADGYVAPWKGQIVSIDQPCQFADSPPLQRLVGSPAMESLARHLASDLMIQWDTEVQRVVPEGDRFRLYSADDRELGLFDIVLWNSPPMQTAKLVPSVCTWKDKLPNVQMVPCWAVMVSFDQRWDVPFDGAFVNCGNLSWIARDSSKPGRPQSSDTWVLHSTVEWAAASLDKPKEQVIEELIAEASRVTNRAMPVAQYRGAHRWLYSRPLDALPDSSLWDSKHKLGACGDWCGGPRVEGAMKSGISLAGRILGSLHENATASSISSKPTQLSLFSE